MEVDANTEPAPDQVDPPMEETVNVASPDAAPVIDDADDTGVQEENADADDNIEEADDNAAENNAEEGNAEEDNAEEDNAEEDNAEEGNAEEGNEDGSENGSDNSADIFDSDEDKKPPAAGKRKKAIQDSEEEDETEEGEKPIKKKKKARLTSSMIDDEAQLSGSDSDSDEDNDGEDSNEYVQDGFVVLDGDVEEVRERKKKEYSRLRKNRGDMLLVEDDIALMHENNAAANEYRDRPVKKLKKTYDNEIGPERRNKSELLTSDNEMSDEADEDGGDEMADFIEDDGDDEDVSESGVRARAPRRRPARSGYSDGPGQEEINEAFDIFGEGYDDYMDDNGDVEEEDEIEESDDDDLFSERAERREERRAAAIKSKKAKQKQKGADGITSTFERSKLIEKFCTEYDDVIRNEDLPERMIGVMPGRTAPDAAERNQEAKWIALKLADKLVAEYDGLSNFPRHFDYRSAHELEDSLLEPVDFVLSSMQNDKYEVPFIWTYRKDYLHDMMTRKHLWWIASMDLTWEDLVGRRNDLLSELQVVASVAEGSLREDTAENLTHQLGSMRKEISQLQAAKQEAHGVYEVALDATDGEDVSADDRAKVARAAIALEEATRAHETAAAEMAAVQASLDEINRKLNLRSSYPQAVAIEFLTLFPPMKYESIIQCTTDDAELKDIQNYCRLLLNTEKARRKKKKLQGHQVEADHYRQVRQPDIRRYINSFAPSAADYGYSLRYGSSSRVNIDTPSMDVLDYASQYVSAEFPTSEDVRNAGRKLIAIEIASEPNVVREARKYYRRHATISSAPTSKGIAEINPMHELFGMHTLVNKPVSELLDASMGPSKYVGGSNRTMYARLVKAEQDGLLKISYSTPDPDKRMLDHFLPTTAAVRGDDLRRHWDVERMNTVVSTINKQLFPRMEQETRRELLRLSKEAIIEETADAYAVLVNAGPYRKSDKTYGDVVLAAPGSVERSTVMSIMLPIGGGDKGSAVYMTYIDQDGLVRSQDSIPYAARNKKREKIAHFMKLTVPDLIVINTSAGFQSTSMEAMIMKFLIKEVQEELKRDREALRNARYEEGYDVPSDDEDDEESFNPEVLLVKDDVAHIYGSSSRSKSEFHGYPAGAAAAVSLARFVQNPIAEYSNMWRCADPIGTFGYEVLSLQLHPLQSLLSEVRAPLLSALETVLVDAVCESGVDLNAAIQHEHLAGTLAFVGGLGLRKADALRFKIRRDLGVVSSRRQMIERKLMGKIVYNNCAGFLRICDNDVIDLLLDPLDDTRIHPECYVLNDYATKMCASAMDEVHNAEIYYELVARVMKRAKTQIAIQLEDACPSHIDMTEFRPNWPGWIQNLEHYSLRQGMYNATVFDADSHPVPRRVAHSTIPGESEEVLADAITLEDALDDLVLEEYAAELEASGTGKHFKQLIQIKNELRYPWLDRRVPLARKPSDDEMFTLITGESDQSIYVGLKVDCHIEEIKENCAYVTINGGEMKGSVWIRNMRDDKKDDFGHFIQVNPEDIGEILPIGSFQPGVIVAVKKAYRRVEISTKKSDIERGEDWWFHNRAKDENMIKWWEAANRPRMLDPYFDQKSALNLYYNYQMDREEAIERHLKSLDKGTTLGRNKPTTRPIFHPYFKNVNYSKAEEMLRSMNVGDVVFRPSSKGGISIAWHFSQDIIKHIDVTEDGEPSATGALGSRLLINGEAEPYSDLDEIIGRYITPMNDFVNMMANYRVFKNLTATESEDFLKSLHASEPQRIHYLVRFDHDHPGYFILTWFVANSRTPVKKEFISVRPEGYRMRELIFTTPSQIMAWFKTNAFAPAKPVPSSSLHQPVQRGAGYAEPPKRKSRFTS